MFYKVKNKQTIEHIRLKILDRKYIDFKLKSLIFFCSLILIYRNNYKYNMYIYFNLSKNYMKMNKNFYF